MVDVTTNGSPAEDIQICGFFLINCCLLAARGIQSAI